VKGWWLTAVGESALIAAKLSGHLDWTWWAVTSPVWGGFALLGLALTVAYGWRMP
jgi:hypothetical protein